MMLVLALAPAWAALASSNPPERRATVLVMGDSLSAGYGIAAAQGWVALLGEKLAGSGSWDVINASISGETTAGGAARVEAEVARHAPDVVVIELGANDGLRGLPLDLARQNLAFMIETAQAHGARVLLIGMEMPPNYGPEYANGFRALYRELAAQYDTALLPFLLEPIARDRSAFQGDNLHPVAEVQPRLLAHVWSALEPLLAR
jgi:acyl-CoA thioesterase-1